jgi:hypothetical protein
VVVGLSRNVGAALPVSTCGLILLLSLLLF